MIGLVSCCGPKLAHAAPARDLYRSPLFRLSRTWAERHCERWFILSALYGLVEPGEVIEPYDRTLGPNERGWGADVALQLGALGCLDARFAVLAGRRYIGPLWDLIELEEPLSGLSIGQRLQWLKKNT